ncbi:nicotinamide-nucleotide amidohydrolase family protein [Apilactobacillus apisilvae]|uniref:Nicotinamide-nucleotide amidohydrolase family protein n=1 Tax=Apilactobacillus apisilvae TaxID=2923364 RepID=A0ABY4PIB9_9LACO|nr:nicotinamide-nucleotide amidohydrolase family protein [Apilactobacillus apisilvae]UQS85186.1 nicotinamide-nucleotide amidohydrolase family protein [Apilactobacillus apisilvae]
MKIDSSIIEKMIQKNISITAAESLTAGMFQSTLGGISGVSAIFPGGFVTYANEAKESMLDIPSTVIDQYGVVSNENAIWMAKQAKNKMNTDVGISFTGVAGPSSLENHPAGTVFIGIDYLNYPVYSKKFIFKGNRNEIRMQSVNAAMKIIENEYNK